MIPRLIHVLKLLGEVCRWLYYVAAGIGITIGAILTAAAWWFR